MTHWLQAFRLRTLPLALSSILMGSFLAYAEGSFNWPIFTFCVVTTVFLQILSNLANDYGDSIHGADSAERAGPKRAVQSGKISSKQMKAAVAVFTMLALVSGLTLLWLAFGTDWRGFGFFLALGLLSIVAAIAYTVGRKPYGYVGLGDLSVLIFFGLVGVLGSYYLFTKDVRAVDLLPAISCGVFSIAVLNVNNIRDIESDRKAGKFSIPVRIGRKNAVRYHVALLTIGLLAAIAHTLLTYQGWQQLIFLVTLPLLASNAKAVSQKPSSELDPYLKQMALSTLLFVVTFGIGLLISRSA